MPSEQSCEICTGSTKQIFMAHGYWVRGCLDCDHRMAEIKPAQDHVETVYDDLYFHGGNAGYSDYLAEGEMLRARGQWYGRLLRKYKEPGSLLDIGAAAGFILQGLQDCGWNGWGIEPNPNQAAFARDQLGLRVEATSLEQFKPERKYDLVSMIQVVAHFVDMRESLRVTSGATQAGSLLLIETWNWQSFTARLFGQSWHEYSPPSVLRWFSPAGLEKLSSQFGFHKIAQGRPSKSIAGSHAKSLLAYKLRELPLGSALAGMTRLIPDKIQIPYPAEDLFWMLFEKR